MRDDDVEIALLTVTTSTPGATGQDIIKLYEMALLVWGKGNIEVVTYTAISVSFNQ